MNTELSEGVAEDFRQALLDLNMNSRYEISNLTVIARENTEHAYAISEALKLHIKQTSAQKKLPAFYVLDSVVKNVGTPYTIFLSRGLFSTFMEAYALVDNNVRRKMDEMLKTWKEPVPGALDTRPVFPREITSPIENALIKARTSALQVQNEYLRNQQPNRGRPGVANVPHRETPTPPIAYRQPPQPVIQNPQNTYHNQNQNSQDLYQNQNSYNQQPQPHMLAPTAYRPPPPTAVSTPAVNYGLPAQPAASNNTNYGLPVQHPPPPPTNASNPISTQLPPSMLLELLRASGRLPVVPSPVAPPANNPTPQPSSIPGFSPSFPHTLSPYVNTPPVVGTPPVIASTPVPRMALAEIPNDVVFSDAHSLKLPRPHLVSKLYEKLGAACTQCGRRFKSDEAGKRKKADHMDWHFKVHQRMREAEKNGQHRSLYVDEFDWIKSRESEGDEVVTKVEGANGASSSVDSKPELQYLPVPDDPALASSRCPICQENFETKWLHSVDEFVWMDARKVGEKIFHATCYADATKDLSSILKRNTPDPVLGKRKSEDDHVALRSKIKAEPVS